MSSATVGWSVVDGALVKEISAPSFSAAFAIVRAVAEIAETLNHHPDIAWSYRTLRLRCYTHTTASVTALDEQLAREIDKVLVERGVR